MALSDVKVKAARVPEGKKQTKLSDGGGLYLLVKSSGKYWKLKYRFAGKEKTLSFSIYPQVSLKEARDKREIAKKQQERTPTQTRPSKQISAKREADFQLGRVQNELDPRDWKTIKAIGLECVRFVFVALMVHTV